MAVRVTTVGFKSIRKRLTQTRLGPLTKRVHSAMVVQWRNAADAFIRAAVRQVLVETGMSAASFFPLSRAIKRVKAVTAVRAKTARGNPLPNKRAALLPNGRRASFPPSPQAGVALGQDAFQFDTGTPTNPVFTFQFSTVVFQHAFHEPSQNSLAAGQDAFTVEINRRFLTIVSQVLSQFLILRPRTRRIVEGI